MPPRESVLPGKENASREAARRSSEQEKYRVEAIPLSIRKRGQVDGKAEESAHRNIHFEVAAGLGGVYGGHDAVEVVLQHRPLRIT